MSYSDEQAEEDGAPQVHIRLKVRENLLVEPTWMWSPDGMVTFPSCPWGLSASQENAEPFWLLLMAWSAQHLHCLSKQQVLTCCSVLLLS